MIAIRSELVTNKYLEYSIAVGQNRKEAFNSATLPIVVPAGRHAPGVWILDLQQTDATCPIIQVMGRHDCRSLVLAQAASTVSVRVVGVARPAIVRLSTGTERHYRGSLGRPSRKGLSCGRGSVAQASILLSNSDMLEVLKGESGLIEWSDLLHWTGKRTYWFSRVSFPDE
ncbi:hypothetical protein TIFTF001_027211 [Ficus carica]|uniref:Uncharacterized protein n=1 Tax=Ficus carica TaxID=3494 RepID=A0AA88DMN5_FICCA|nr:hypothetical protein TIFTF001_027211 [Ficus carica]